MKREHRLDIILNDVAVRFSEDKKGWLTIIGEVMTHRAKAQRYAARLAFIRGNNGTRKDN